MCYHSNLFMQTQLILFEEMNKYEQFEVMLTNLLKSKKRINLKTSSINKGE